jgi:hypothetical protein
MRTIMTNDERFCYAWKALASKDLILRLCELIRGTGDELRIKTAAAHIAEYNRQIVDIENVEATK